MKNQVKHRVLVSPIHWRSREHARKLQIKANEDGTVEAIRKYLRERQQQIQPSI